MSFIREAVYNIVKYCTGQDFHRTWLGQTINGLLQSYVCEVEVVSIGDFVPNYIPVDTNITEEVCNIYIYIYIYI